MSEANGTKLSINVFMNKEKSKVLFAEANGDVVDILLTFLALPLGRVVRVLEKHYSNEAPVFGSITSLYRGLSNLDATHFSVAGAKQMLLNPRSSFEADFCRFKLDITDRQVIKYFICQGDECPKRESGMIISVDSDIYKCECGKPLNRGLIARDRVPGDGGVFSKHDSSFIICDDLRVVPIVTGLIQTLNTLGINIADANIAEMRSVSLGIGDFMDLLKLSLISATPLSDFIIKDDGRKMCVKVIKPEPFNNKGDAGKMILNVSLQKSTNKFLFAQATSEFADLLFSFLTLPLGGVELLLGGKSSLKSIDNLYGCVRDLIEDKYFTTPDTRNRLVINPKLAHGYISKLHLVGEDTPPKLYYKLEKYTLFGPTVKYRPMRADYYHNNSASCFSFKWIKGIHEHKYLKELKMCMVRDDLSVTPYSIASSISILDGLGIPLSDVRETELHIGMEEALSLLKASLTSKTPFTDALINPMLNKLP